ncbi:MAG: cell division protein FtsQ/DivIB [Actinomycetia bacterium]|nr:cell division protein FtsQ/DivIB [Actinomycetes bacterium]MCH9801656.1 cell division protein FtsQ/DivIB [Actinomycetes bacterium]
MNTLMDDPIVETEPGIAQIEEPPQRRFRPRRSRVIAVGVLAAGLVAAAYWMMSWSSPIPVRDVVVVGALPETAEQVLAAAGIPDGTALRDVDQQTVVSAAVAVEGIEAAELELERPWTVVIQVDERIPFAIRGEKGNWIVFDQQGEPIREEGSRPKGLPVISGEDSRWPELADALAAIEQQEPGVVREANISDDGLIALRLDGGSEVTWGRSELNQDKAQVLAALMSLKADGYVVSTPDRPSLVGDAKLPKRNTDQEESQPQPESVQ